MGDYFIIQNDPMHKISTFRGALDFFGTKIALAIARAIYEPKTSRAPRKVSNLCRDHLESLNWLHLVIWQGRFHHIYGSVALIVLMFWYCCKVSAL
jgi:hypothetical protein